LIPSIGETIYIPNCASFDPSEAAIFGGLATIGEVSLAYGDPFVSLKELPGYSYNFRVLSEKQSELKKSFGKKRARIATDERTLFGTIKRAYQRILG
jgi:hypothetical protein